MNYSDITSRRALFGLSPMAWLICAAAWMFLVAKSPAAETSRRNVLFIVADDQNNHLGCYGYDVKTPSIDELARRGMRFDRAYCQDPLCNPSRVSFLSGLRPDRTRVYTLATHTREFLGDWVMLPEYFRKNGYFTVQVGKIYHTEDGFEDPRSWDVEIRESGKRPPPDQVVKAGKPNAPGGHSVDWMSLKTSDDNTPDGIVARTAVKRMEQAVADKKPFFLGVGFRRPHAPYAAPQKYFELYPRSSVKLADAAPNGHFAGLLPAAVNYPVPSSPMTEQEQREIIASYYACTTFMDAQVGVLLDALGRLRLWDNTIIVFIGDHGYHLGEHGGLWHKLSLFEESARVPMIVYAPGMKANGKACERLVEMIDLYPTLVSLCSLPARKGLDGIDLSPLLDDPTRPSKQAAYTVVARANDPSLNQSKVLDYLGRSVRTERWRYTEWDDGKRGVELYDHEKDPHEWHNLANDPKHANTARSLHQLIVDSKSPAHSP